MKFQILFPGNNNNNKKLMCRLLKILPRQSKHKYYFAMSLLYSHDLYGHIETGSSRPIDITYGLYMYGCACRMALFINLFI